MRKIRKGSLSYWFLVALEKSVDGFVRFNDYANNPGYYAYWDGWNYPLNKSSLAQAIRRLREDGIIKEVKIGDEVVFKLADDSKNMDLDTDQNEQWDGKWRIVVFDIPEQKRIVRNLFRRNLKKWGFINLQKSVWISKRNIFDKLNKYVMDLGLDRWIVLIEADKISSDYIRDAIVQ